MRLLTIFRITVALAIAAPFVGCADSESLLAQQGGGGYESDGGGSGGDGGDCTLTQGYWKNHEEAWPVSTLTLGTVGYSQAQLLAILNTPVAGNGLISLAHQLIAAKLNVAFGADDTTIADDIADADALIGGLVVPPVGSGHLATSTTSYLVGALDGFNNSRGDTCGDGPTCGDGELDAGEACDDGNTAAGDGCSPWCTVEREPCCGDGHLDGGEECDDGNTRDGDGCTANCQIECNYDPTVYRCTLESYARPELMTATATP